MAARRIFIMYLENNIKELKNKNPEVCNAILENISKDDYKEISKEFRLVDTKDGDKTVEVYSDSRFVRLNSIYSPEREALHWTNKLNKVDNITSVVMFGIGTGVFYRSIKKVLNSSTYLFLYEPDFELFLFCFRNFDMTEMLSDERVFIYVDNVNSSSFLSDLSVKLNWAMISTQMLCVHPIYDKLYNEKYIKFVCETEQLKNMLNARKNTSVIYAKKFTVNAIKNLQYVKESNYIGELKGIIDENIPFIIVSAGPSLDKNIDALKMAEKKSVILATDTAVKYLLAHNIAFDAIITVDGRKSVSHLADERCASYPIFTVPDAKSEVLERNHGKKIWINGSGYLQNLYSKYGCLFPEYNSGGSVATAAFWVAQEIGAKNIILIGQDLAFKGDKTHAGDIKNQCSEWIEEKEIYIDSINGDKIKTRYDWLGYLRWFENMIVQSGENINVIDATEGGAKISGTRIMKLTEAIDKYCSEKVDFRHILTELPATFGNEKYKSVHRDIEHIKKELECVYDNSKTGIASANRILQMFEQSKIIPKKVDINMKKINDVQKSIQKQNIYLLLDEYISADISDRIEAAAKKYDTENEKLYETAKSMDVLFKALLKAVDELMPVLCETLKKI